MSFPTCFSRALAGLFLIAAPIILNPLVRAATDGPDTAKPPANEMTSGASVSFKVSRMALGRSPAVRAASRKGGAAWRDRTVGEGTAGVFMAVSAKSSVEETPWPAGFFQA